MHWTLNKIFLIAAVVLVAGGIVFGFLKIGSPAKNRMLALDARRLSDLYNIANTVYGMKNNPTWATSTLPVSLENVQRLSQYSNVVTTDPAGKPYTYSVMGTSTFELCATFEIEQHADEAQLKSGSADPTFWDHPAGDHCFQFSLDKYPPYYYYNNYYPSAPTPAMF